MKLEILLETGFVEIAQDGSIGYLGSIDAEPITFNNQKYIYFIRHPQPESSRCIIYRINREELFYERIKKTGDKND